MTQADRGRPVLPVRTTLLHRPASPQHAVLRGALLDTLDRGLDRTATVLTAPTGFGKTVLISQWCESNDRPVAWLSLTPAMDRPTSFGFYLATAVRTVVPDALEDFIGLHDVGRLVDFDELIAELSNGLDDIDERLLIVLDDYHVLRSPETHRVMSALLAHPPTAVHFVVISRQDPALPLGALRAGGHLCELRMSDLAFTEDQLRTFVERELDQALDDATIHSLYASTEGWPAGTRLAVEALRHGNRDVVGAGFLDRGAQEYLVAEVLQGIPVHVLRYLVAASYFDQFSAELCDAVVATAPAEPSPMTGADFISWITRNNLFVVPLDDDGRWFRFHHLFARRLETWRRSHGGFGLEEAAFRRAAAQIFLDHGFLQPAIDQLHLAGEERTAVDLSIEFGTTLIDEELWGELGSFLESVPTDVMSREPGLLVLRAWHVGDNRGRHREMYALLDQADELLRADPAHDDADLRGQIAVLRGTYSKLNRGDFDGALADSETARRLMSTSPGRHLAYAYALGAVALANSGRHDEARQLTESVVGDQRFADMAMDPTIWMRPYLAWLEGDLAALERDGRHMISVGSQYEHRATIASGHYFAGIAAYERNDLLAAEHHLSITADTRFTTLELRLHGAAAMALTESALGRDADASATADAAVAEALAARGDYYLPTVQALTALLDLRAGRLASAQRWAGATDAEAARHRYMFFDRAPVLVEILLSSAEDEAAGRALLDRLLTSPGGRFNRPLNVKLLGLSALVHARDGEDASALEVLGRGVRIAHDGGLIRSLADLGPELNPMLLRLDATGSVLDHVGSIVDAINAPDSRDASSGSPAVVASVAGGPALTNREMDVLRLLAERYTNREIARELYIAPGTVKKRTVSLYSKLNVHGRREAVAKARALGYLSD